MGSTPSYQRVTEALGQLGADVSAAELHGLLCGALCVAPATSVDALALLGETPKTGGAVDTLRALRDAAAESLADLHVGFAPLLPEDVCDLADRARALAAWCEGFLFGFAGRRRIELSRCSEELREIIADFGEFTRAGLREADDLQVEENAYAELVEYIRVGAQLVFMELREFRGGDAPATVH